MGLYRRGKFFWFRIMQNGKRIQVSTKTDIKKLAERIYAKALTEIQEGKWFEGVKAKSIIISELMERYCRDRLKAKSSNTVMRDRTLRRHMEKNFGSYSLAEVTSEMLSAYRQRRYDEGKSIATVNRELAFLRNAYNVAKRHYRWCSQNPVSDIKLDRENNQRDKWLTVEQEARVLSTLSGRYQDIVRLVINTGLRQDEALSLPQSQVDLFRKTIMVKGKGNKIRTIPLNQIAFDILKERLKTRHINSDLVFPSSMGTKIQKQRLLIAFKKAVKQAGIVDFTFHDLRHTFATRLAQAGVDLYAISKLLGHSEISTTQRYAHHCPESLRHSVEILENYYNFTTFCKSTTNGIKEGVL